MRTLITVVVLLAGSVVAGCASAADTVEREYVDHVKATNDLVTDQTETDSDIIDSGHRVCRQIERDWRGFATDNGRVFDKMQNLDETAGLDWQTAMDMAVEFRAELVAFTRRSMRLYCPETYADYADEIDAFANGDPLPY